MAVVQWAAESTIKMSIKRIERHTVQRQVTQSIIPNGKQNVKHGDVHCSHQRSSAACSLLISEVQYGDLHCSHQQSSAAVFTVDTRGPAWRCSLLTPGSSAAVFTVDTRDPARRCPRLLSHEHWVPGSARLEGSTQSSGHRWCTPEQIMSISCTPQLDMHIWYTTVQNGCFWCTPD